MRVIAHRGNLNGPTSEENHPDYLIKASAAGFDVETDVWLINNNFYLGHDEKKHKISYDFLKKYSKNFWYHAKNLEILYFLLGDEKINNVFYHQNDDYTLTKNNYIWSYPGKEVSDISIIVDMSAKKQNYQAFGICTDYPLLYV